MSEAAIDAVIRFWFEALTSKDWYRKDEALDAEIRRRFGAIYEELKAGVPPSWLTSPKGVLAAILVLDQFPRNMFRDDPRAFATDRTALALAKQAIGEGLDLRASAGAARVPLYAVSAFRGRSRSGALDRALYRSRQ